MYVLMLVLGCLAAMSVYAAAGKSSKEKGEVPAGKPDSAPEAVKEKAVLLTTETDKVSYAIGAQMGQNFKRQGIEINIELLIRGLKDATAEKDLVLTQDQMRQVMMSFRQRMMAQQQERQNIEGAKNLAAGKVFLEANKTKKGVKVLPSGLQYKVIKEGTGKTPTASNEVKTHYRGRLIDGTEFDSSYNKPGGKPVEFPVTRVIRGWTEALQLMKEGAKWELYIPPDLAYGERGSRTIPPNSTLVFEIELIEVLASKPTMTPPITPRQSVPITPRKSPR
jgi:FKBP-type peptidyl-prolyl cis-trans isomerase FklB